MKNIEPNHPAKMPASARAAEITSILAAAAIIREHTAVNRQATANPRAVGLAINGHQRVHTTPYQRRSCDE